MGSAIAERIKADYQVTVFDKDKEKTKLISGISLAASVKDMANASEVILLCVKPQDFDHVLSELKNSVKGRLFVSIAAGISTEHIEKVLGKVRLIRAMPNLGAMIAESVTCICKGKFAGEDDVSFANELFYRIGVIKDIEEDMMDAATAISGSGPGYIFDFIAQSGFAGAEIPEHAKHDIMKRLERAAQAVGFGPEDAAFLAANTTNTSINMLKVTRLPAVELRKQVASKGGTTEAALVVLGKGGTWEEAAQAALQRAKELTKGK